MPCGTFDKIYLIYAESDPTQGIKGVPIFMVIDLGRKVSNLSLQQNGSQSFSTHFVITMVDNIVISMHGHLHPPMSRFHNEVKLIYLLTALWLHLLHFQERRLLLC
jgi:hypothetical protein